MIRIASWAVTTPMGDGAATLAALVAGTARPGRLWGGDTGNGDLEELLTALGRTALAGGGCDLVLTATTKGDLPRWCAGILADPPRLDGGPADLGRRLAAAFGCPGHAVSAACASGPIALAEAARAIRHDGRRRVLVLGGDRLAPFVEAGFAGLGAVDPGGDCHPFDRERAGIALGETAAAVLLAAGPGPGPYLLGWGQGLDAVHLTGPARDGAGLARACAAALGGRIPGLIVGHGTGTRANDGAELAAYDGLLPGVPLAGWKGGLGHSLGPCGLVEAALCAEALASTGAAPGTSGLRTAMSPRVLPPGAHRATGPWLSPNAGFGGLNGAVLIGMEEPPAAAAPPRPTAGACRYRLTGADLPGGAELAAAGRPAADLAGRLPRPTARQVTGAVDPTWGRMDGPCRLLVALAHGLAAIAGPWPAGAGIVLATETGCMETDARFEQARRQGRAEPQLFAYTLPSAALGEASIRLHLTGPGHALPGADDEAARASARRLLAEGCPAVLVARIDAGHGVETAWAEWWA